MHELLLFARTAAFTIANVQLPFHITFDVFEWRNLADPGGKLHSSTY
jgi:hypothetical protein